jgi:transposase InsO family protein
VKFDFIAAENALKTFEVEFMCRMLSVSSSGYYASRKRSCSQRDLDDLELVPLIHAEFRKYPRGCGARTIQGALRDHGRGTSRKRVVRLMAEENLRHKLKRRFVHTTQSRHEKPVAPNVVDRGFEVGKPNKIWSADLTYLPTKKGWAYLAVILDLGSRKVVGWSVSPTMEEQVTLTALENALQQRRPAAGLVHHSDRGVHYASHAYQALLVEQGVVCSMSRKGNCWDNAVVESFFSSLKRELPNDHLFEDWNDAERGVFAYIEAHYNTHRRHSALGYVSPNEYERRAA